MNEVKPVQQVDLPRFMGDWYVIAVIPTMIETQAYNAIENYQLNADGTIATTFTYYKGAFDGPFKTYHPKGFVVKNTGNAVWGMQFIWPIKADFRIAYLDENYQRTIIARNARDYVWLMARTPQISDADYQAMVKFTADLGYDMSKLRKVPQSWPAPAPK
ncbi:MAG TPA: lipocalin family protein [Methylophilus sp.]